MDAHHRRRIEECLGLGGSAAARTYIERTLIDAPNDSELLELAAECAHGECDLETELRFRMRAFNATPNFSALRKLADALSRAGRWEMAAETWLHIARARPLDAQAFAQAAAALSRLERHALAATAWECACRIQPHNTVFADNHANAVRMTQASTPQESDPKGRNQL